MVDLKVESSSSHSSLIRRYLLEVLHLLYIAHVGVSSCPKSREHYPSDLGRTSVIICFTNEARSALLRTVVR